MLKPNHKFWFSLIVILTYIGIGLLGNAIVSPERNQHIGLSLLFGAAGLFSLFIAYLIGRKKI